VTDTVTVSARHEFASALLEAGRAAFKVGLTKPREGIFESLTRVDDDMTGPIHAVLYYYLPDYDCDLADELMARAFDQIDDAMTLGEGTPPALRAAQLQLATDFFNYAVVLYVGLLPEVEAA
jgi:hypothetical protein